MFKVGDLVKPKYFWAKEGDSLWIEGQVIAIDSITSGSVEYILTDGGSWGTGTKGWDDYRSLELVYTEFPYDPTQQGDTDDDI